MDNSGHASPFDDMPQQKQFIAKSHTDLDVEGKSSVLIKHNRDQTEISESYHEDMLSSRMRLRAS